VTVSSLTIKVLRYPPSEGVADLAERMERLEKLFLDLYDGLVAAGVLEDTSQDDEPGTVDVDGEGVPEDNASSAYMHRQPGELHRPEILDQP
jgi:hypothetical protein